MADRTRLVFMGSGEIACPALDMLLARPEVELAAVLSQPDRPKGRRRRPAPCALKAFATERGLTVLTPEKVGEHEVVAALTALRPDLIVVVAYGQYLPGRVLDIPRLGAINIHPSLLPRYRGASPIQWAIAEGETVTGVTILYVGKEMDAGDIILQEEVPIEPEDTTATLKPRLARVGSRLLGDAVSQVVAGTAPRRPQDEAHASYVAKLEKQDGRIDWHTPAAAIRNRIRGFYPWPGCYAEVPADSGQFLKVIAARVLPGSGIPGEIVALEKEGPVVAAAEDSLLLLAVQPEGRQEMSGRAYLNGHALAVGDQLG